MRCAWDEDVEMDMPPEMVAANAVVGGEKGTMMVMNDASDDGGGGGSGGEGRSGGGGAAMAVNAEEAEAAPKPAAREKEQELQKKLGKMVVANMTHRLLIDTNQAIVGGSTIGARHCNDSKVQGDGFCLLRSVCQNSKVVNICEGQDVKCRGLLADMVERQLSSSQKTQDLILSLLYSLGDYIAARKQETVAPEWMSTLKADIYSLAVNGGIETLSGKARGMHPIPSPPMSSHLIPHHPTPSYPIPSHPHTTTSHPIPPPR